MSNIEPLCKKNNNSNINKISTTKNEIKKHEDMFDFKIFFSADLFHTKFWPSRLEFKKYTKCFLTFFLAAPGSHCVYEGKTIKRGTTQVFGTIETLSVLIDYSKIILILIHLKFLWLLFQIAYFFKAIVPEKNMKVWPQVWKKSKKPYWFEMIHWNNIMIHE